MRAMNETSAGQMTCAAFWVKGIAETLEAAGLDIPALFEEAELELAALSDADARFPTGLQRLWADLDENAYPHLVARRRTEWHTLNRPCVAAGDGQLRGFRPRRRCEPS